MRKIIIVLICVTVALMCSVKHPEHIGSLKYDMPSNGQWSYTGICRIQEQDGESVVARSNDTCWEAVVTVNEQDYFICCRGKDPVSMGREVLKSLELDRSLSDDYFPRR